MADIGEGPMTAIGAAAHRHQRIYPPIFTRNHRIAAIVYTTNKGSDRQVASTFGVDMCESAPSSDVTRDIVKMFAPYRRSYALNFAHPAPHRTAPHRTAPHRTALAAHRTGSVAARTATAIRTHPRTAGEATPLLHRPARGATPAVPRAQCRRTSTHCGDRSSTGSGRQTCAAAHGHRRERGRQHAYHGRQGWAFFLLRGADGRSLSPTGDARCQARVRMLVEGAVGEGSA